MEPENRLQAAGCVLQAGKEKESTDKRWHEE
jgi:hypothetical protein